MSTGRRDFLHTAGLAPVAASVLTGLGQAAQAGTGPELLRRHFSPLQGRHFTLQHPEHGAAEVRLAEVAALSPAGDDQRSFRLVFESLSGQPLPQATWDLHHPELGTHALLLSPNNAAATLTEAVFNRL